MDESSIKEGKKRYGMSQSGMVAGYDCCEYPDSMTSADEALEEKLTTDQPAKWGGFLTRNNTWERI